MRTRRRNRSRRRSRRGGGPSFFSRFFGTSSAPAAPIPDHPDELMMRKQKSDDFEPLILPIDMASRSYKGISNSCVEGTTFTFQEVLTTLREHADGSAISDINHPLDCSKNVVPIDLLVKKNNRYLVPGFDIKEGNIIFDFKKEYTDLQSLLTLIQASTAVPLPAVGTLSPTAVPLPSVSTLSPTTARLLGRLSDQDRRGQDRSESVRRPDQAQVQGLGRSASIPRVREPPPPSPAQLQRNAARGPKSAPARLKQFEDDQGISPGAAPRINSSGTEVM